MKNDTLREEMTARQEIYRGTVVHLTRDTVRLPDGGEATREVVWRRGAVAIVPLTDSGEVYFVEQYRYPMGQVLLEIPAGKLDPGEPTDEAGRLAAARRELAEETGFTAREMRYLGEFYGSPAVESEGISLYLATGLSAGSPHPDADEFLRVRRIPLEVAVDMICRGEIPDGKTQAAILRVERLWDERLSELAARERAGHGGRYDAILWDLDGTLTDPGEGITNSVAYALEKMGRPVPPRVELYPYIGPPLLDSFRLRAGMTAEEAAQALTLYREYFAERGILENAVYEGIREMLERFAAAGERLYLATSKPEVYARRILAHFGLTKYFRFIGGSDMKEKRADKAAVIAYIVRETGIDPARSVMIGDREYDVAGAKKNGMDAVGVLWGYGSREELTAAGARWLWEDPAKEWRSVRA